ncbi:type I glyceraldehyde-3-phosphate dehydrogenase [Natranaerobius thermophilus]|uniref:Glyceraldehyde-3-phosphate dehydrogenase n=1 Tax=Natranaerobius thermophilus (strain ATCC BAA-1301 / DSM 18059 / JW/NM-WN-LF) TaxID=457570 RepID=B2A8M3_NATTJ|nr:type I glyceraldehyde-3-phosphate dehydrogenase [Natranaerobius thermophilus]ACB85907.1 glyceraldehyde-3-phosphate dehydrogenase [Natranaerobius thermophilus JW/NM-WN-LF]
MTVRVAINGFGRIGRHCLRNSLNNKQVEVVAVNDLADINTLSHLFKYDSLYGPFQGELKTEGDELVVDGNRVKVLNEKEPEKLPWDQLDVDIVLEATGIFRDRDGAKRHLDAGADRVIITAPAKNEDITIVMGVNENDYNPNEHRIISKASCTTNCVAPVVKVLDEAFGIEKALMTTVHSYTNDQQLLDLPHKDLRRGRAAAESIIPTTTGAAKAVSSVLPQLEGKIDGYAMRVPTPTVSIVDLACTVNKDTVTRDQVNEKFKEASEEELDGILGYSDEPLVSMDYKGSTESAVVDAISTMVVQDNMVKAVAWYDNEWAYARRVIDLAAYIGNNS